MRWQSQKQRRAHWDAMDAIRRVERAILSIRIGSRASRSRKVTKQHCTKHTPITRSLLVSRPRIFYINELTPSLVRLVTLRKKRLVGCLRRILPTSL